MLKLHGESSNYIRNLSFAVVGLARNCENSLSTDIHKIRKAISNSKFTTWLIVESDSSDQTVKELYKLSNEIPDFNFISLGELSTRIPKRTDRISHCRNYYAEQIRDNKKFSKIDYVIVADLDGINTLISEEALESCWNRKDWDVCAANQKGPYYDIWALRHKDWCAEDCWAQYRFLNQYNIDFYNNIQTSVYSKMITIPENSEWIEVDSAFGGFAIYKKSTFNYCEYVGINQSGEEFCEHTHFHKILKNKGARIFINPKLINADWTEHTKSLLLSNQIKLKINFLFKRIVFKIIERDRVKQFRKVLQAATNIFASK